MLLIEFVAIFVGLPLGYRFLPLQISPLPLLWMVSLYCYLVLRRDPSFPVSRLWNTAATRGQLKSIFVIFCPVALVLGFAVYWLAPGMFFGLVRDRPILWAIIMVGYPILSVYPQSIVYRAFLMHRYAGLAAGSNITPRMQSMLLVFVSALAFAFMHIIFRNWLAVSMTFAGGLLFAWRYRASNSLAVSALEHALYGCLLFTLGLGRYFYHGHIRLS